MPKLTILPFEETIEVFEGDTIRDALIRQGINIESPCDGQGICGQCGVWVESPSDIPETPHENITQEQSDQGLRLSCQIKPQTDMTIRLPLDFTRDAKRFREAQRILEGERLTWTRIVSAVQVKCQEDAWIMTYDRLPESQKLLNWKKTFTPKGLAIDLGTTTIVVTLISLLNGEELATASRLNPQIQFGHDVMTRIQHGSTDKGLEKLSSTVRKGINQLIEQVCQDSYSESAEILDVTIGGNTTMLQLAFGIDPAPLGKVPFRVDLEGGTSYPIRRLGLEINSTARVYVPPIMHAFVGTDISAGLLMSGEFFDDERSILYIDIGTNGEMGLNVQGKRLVTSTAAGPAFEGMGLSGGMRASVGAVEKVKIINNSGLEIQTIGNASVKGICGSGIIDLLAALLRLGIIEPSGRLKQTTELNGLSPDVLSRIVSVDGQMAFQLGKNVYFSQKDIRQVQLAKGAIRAAIDLLLDKTEFSSDILERIVIAGGFGYSLNPDNLERIGLIPPQTQSKISFAGNASRSGCVWLLTDIAYRRFLEERMHKMKHLSIANNPKFMDHYISCMEFPVQDTLYEKNSEIT